MEWDRVIAVTGSGGLGSGYLLAPNLVLTSAHVVVRETARVTVFRPGRLGTFAGTVVWCGTAAERDDAALVRVTDTRWEPPSVYPVAWGRTVTYQPGIACQSWGRPDLAQRPNKPVDVAQPRGTLSPGDSVVGDRYVVELTGFPPEPRADGSSPWGGMSGAAVFCGDLLAGVIAADVAGSAHARLAVVPAYVLLRDKRFRSVAQEAAGAVWLRCEPIELHRLIDRQSQLNSRAPAATPATLLTARRAVIPFHGRDQVLADLQTWAAEAGLGVWLLSGPAGQGKTRLAHHFGQVLLDEGWVVVWLDAGASRDELAVLSEVETKLMVVVDYAESRSKQLDELISRLARRKAAMPTKVLLLARTTGGWWTSLATAGDTVADVLDTANHHELAVLDIGPAQQQQTYRSAVSVFAQAAGELGGAHHVDWAAAAETLTAQAIPQFAADATVLTVHMHALVDLLDTATMAGDGVSTRPDSGRARNVADRVLDHERRYWRATARNRSVTSSLDIETLTDTVAATVVLAPVDAETLAETLRCVPELADQSQLVISALRDWLMSLYPGPNPGIFGGLAPDRLGEQLVGGRIADTSRPCVIEALARTLTEPDRIAHLLTVCARAAAHPTLKPTVGDRLTGWCVEHADTLLVPAVRVAMQVETPAPLLAAIDTVIGRPAVDTITLIRLTDAIPARTLVLADTAVTLASTIVARLRDGQDHNDDDELARMLSNLANRLSEVGLRTEGLAAAQEAADLYRELVAQRPELFLRALAGSRHNLATYLDDVARGAEGLAAAQEAVDLYRPLVTTDPQTYLPELAASLNTLANRLAEAGQPEHGLAAAQEAVGIRRELAAEHPDAFLPALATSLNTVAMRLGEVGRAAEGLAAAEESVDQLRRLTAAHAETFGPELAASVHTLAMRLAAVGRSDDALIAAQEAVRRYRELHVQHPGAFGPALAASVHNLAVRLSAVRRRQDGLEAAEESVSLYRGLDADRPGVFRSRLAESVSNMAIGLGAVGRRADALIAAEEAINILTGLTARRPGYRTDLDRAERIQTLLRELGDNR